MNCIRYVPLLIGLILCGGCAHVVQPEAAGDDAPLPWQQKTIPFRSMMIWYDDPRDENGDFWDRNKWTDRLAEMGREGFTAVIWCGPSEIWPPAAHSLLRLEKFPEAREIPPEENERMIAQAKWMFREAKNNGMDNFLYPQVIWFTEAFAKAHGLDKKMPESPTVSHYHMAPYGKLTEAAKCGVRTELTRAYVEALFTEFPQVYEDLDGFYAPIGEPLPGNRSTYFGEAIAPGLKASGRRPLFIAHQWQVPLRDYVKNIVPKEIYDNTWLGFHAWNSEQITDAKPYPGLVRWVEETGLPTVVAIYPANVRKFPFNSPKLAFEITREMKKVDGIVGFYYWPFSPSLGGKFTEPDISFLFRRALAHYASTTETYSDEPWVAILEERFGDRQAAQHFLNAYNVSGRIIPEMFALVYQGGDTSSKELRLPYQFLAPNSQSIRHTSPARGNALVPILDYAKRVAADPKMRDEIGEIGDEPPFTQHARWDSHGGSFFDTPPSIHMRNVRAMGEEALREAQAAMRTVKKNRKEAQNVYNWMKAYQLISRYYERKIAAATEALIYTFSNNPQHRADAERLADEALATYVEAGTFIDDKINPVMVAARGKPLLEEVWIGKGKEEVPDLIDMEKEERAQFAKTFGWPDRK